MVIFVILEESESDRLGGDAQDHYQGEEAEEEVVSGSNFVEKIRLESLPVLHDGLPRENDRQVEEGSKYWEGPVCQRPLVPSIVFAFVSKRKIR